jgi:predicted TIM-barrel fold metal-dependent hydrolase
MRNRREFILEIIGTLSTTSLTERIAWATPSAAKGAVDSHAHIFLHNLEMAQQHRYVPDYDAPLAHYLTLLDTHGITNGLLVQPSFLGTDNSFMLAALKAYPERLRGVAVIEPGTDLQKLDELHSSGCVGIRLNLIGNPDPDLSKKEWQAIFRKSRDLDWLVEVQIEASRLKGVIEPLLEQEVRVVVDHFGRPDPVLGVNDPGFQYLLSKGKTGRVWVKISGAYRNGEGGRGEQVAFESMPLLRDSFGLQRLVWGSDWPHTQFEKTASYDAAYHLMCDLLPQERDRNIVLWDTPSQLFGFTYRGAHLTHA